MTQNFMKVPRGTVAGLLSKDQSPFLSKQQQQQQISSNKNQQVKHLADTDSEMKNDNSFFYKNGQNVKLEQNLNTDNKRYAIGKKKQNLTGDQELGNKLVVQGVHTLSGDNMH